MDDRRPKLRMRSAAAAISFVLIVGMPHHVWMRHLDPFVALLRISTLGSVPFLGISAAFAMSSYKALPLFGSKPFAYVVAPVISAFAAIALALEYLVGFGAIAVEGVVWAAYPTAVPFVCFLGTMASTFLLLSDTRGGLMHMSCAAAWSFLDSLFRSDLFLVFSIMCCVVWWTICSMSGWIFGWPFIPPAILPAIASGLMILALRRERVRCGDDIDGLRHDARAVLFGSVMSVGLLEMRNFSLDSVIICSWALPLLWGIVACARIVWIRIRSPYCQKDAAVQDDVDMQIDTQLQSFLLGFDLAESERAVVTACLIGKTSTEAAAELGIRPSTARSYMQRAYRKIGVSSLQELKALIRGAGSGEAGRDLSVEIPGESGSSCLIGKTKESRVFAIAVPAAACSVMVLVYLLCFSPLTCSPGPMLHACCGFVLGVLSRAVFPRVVLEGRKLCVGTAITLLLAGAMLYRIGFAVIDPYHDPLIYPHAWAFATYLCFGCFAPSLARALCGLVAAGVSCGGSTRCSRLRICAVAALMCACSSWSYALWALVAVLAWIVGAASMLALFSRFGFVFSQPYVQESNQEISKRNAAVLVVAFGMGAGWVETWQGFVGYLAPVLPVVFFATVFLLVAVAAQRSSRCRQFVACLLLALIVGMCAAAADTVYPYLYRSSSGLLSAIFIFLMSRHLLGFGTNRAAWRDIMSAVAGGLVFGQWCASLSIVDAEAQGTLMVLSSTYDYMVYAACRMVLFSALFLTATACAAIAIASVVRGESRNISFIKAPDAVTLLFRAHGLSETEISVLLEIVRGLSGPEIAKALHCSAGSVNSARRNGYRKLGVHSKRQLVELVDQVSRAE